MHKKLKTERNFLKRFSTNRHMHTWTQAILRKKFFSRYLVPVNTCNNDRTQIVTDYQLTLQRCFNLKEELVKRPKLGLDL